MRPLHDHREDGVTARRARPDDAASLAMPGKLFEVIPFVQRADRSGLSYQLPVDT
jgi:hypothetical protein